MSERRTLPQETRTPGVRKLNTRHYLAGVLIAERGLAHGITPDMVDELDELYGKRNPEESLFQLRKTHHAVRGYLDGLAEQNKETQT